MLTAWCFIATFFVYWYLRLRIYKGWSNLYRGVWERKYRDVKIRTFASLSMLAPFMKSGILWRSDSWKELFDAVSSPQRCQQIFSGAEPPPKHGLDCDEHGIYLTASIEKSLAEGTLTDKVSHPRFFTVLWFEGWVPNGHNVCLMEDRRQFQTRYVYMDYGLPSEPCATIQDVADLIRKTYSKAAPSNTFPLTWCVSKLDLTPELIHWG